MGNIFQLTPEQVETVLEDLKTNKCIPTEDWEEVREELMRQIEDNCDD